jgi:predicted HicB family RNase H-like nuclease
MTEKRSEKKAKKRMGRPTLGEQAMGTVLRLRLADDLREALAKAADDAGISDSEYVRQALLEKLGRRASELQK